MPPGDTGVDLIASFMDTRQLVAGICSSSSDFNVASTLNVASSGGSVYLVEHSGISGCG